MSVYVYENLNDQIIERLRDFGYKVNKLPYDFREYLPTSIFLISLV